MPYSILQAFYLPLLTGNINFFRTLNQKPPQPFIKKNAFIETAFLLLPTKLIYNEKIIDCCLIAQFR